MKGKMKGNKKKERMKDNRNKARKENSQRKKETNASIQEYIRNKASKKERMQE